MIDRLAVLGLVLLSALAPPSPASAQNANAAPAGAADIQTRQTADGHAVVSFPIDVLRGSDLDDTVEVTFDFGDSTKGLDKPVVNEDKSIIAVTNYPATKTSYVSLFLRNGGGDLIAINGLNLRVGKFINARWATAAQSRLAVKSISGRVLTLAAFDYTQGNQAEEYDFKIAAAADGTLTLVK
jgi:hypothetical protein